MVRNIPNPVDGQGRLIIIKTTAHAPSCPRCSSSWTVPSLAAARASTPQESSAAAAAGRPPPHPNSLHWTRHSSRRLSHSMSGHLYCYLSTQRCCSIGEWLQKGRSGNGRSVIICEAHTFDIVLTCVGTGIIAAARVQHVRGAIVLATRVGRRVGDVIRRQFASLTGLFRVGRWKRGRFY